MNPTAAYRLSSSSPLRRTAAWAAITALLAVAAPPPMSAQPQRPATPAVTVRLDRVQVQPFLDSFLTLDAAIIAKKAPADGTRQLDDIARKIPAAKAAIREFVAGLRRAKQAEAFDAAVYTAAGTVGQPTLSGDIRKEGGAVAILAKADLTLDELVTGLRNARGTSGMDALLEILGLSVVLEARRGTGCSVFVFVLTLGYGERANYRMCMGGAR